MSGDQIRLVARTSGVETIQPRPKHTFEQVGPFTRAYVTVYGRSQIEALESARRAREQFAAELPVDVTCWAPVYKGIDSDLRRHCAVFIVAFPANAEALRARVDGLVAHLYGPASSR